jgi:hypothetical protein
MREFSELSIAIVISLFALGVVYAAKDLFVSTSLSPQPLKLTQRQAAGGETWSAWSPPMPPAAPILARQPVHQECNVSITFGRSLLHNASEALEASCSAEKPDE